MRKYTAKGYANGIIAAISYGTNPLFALPMFAKGIGVNSVLFYRYFLAVLLYGAWLVFYKKISLKISYRQFGCIFCLAVVFSLSSLFLFDAFNYMDSGIACTILFSYPLMVALMSRTVFKEKISVVVWVSMLMAIGGIVLLYSGASGGNISIHGIILVLLSSLAYAVYMVGVKHVKAIRHIKPDKLTFYVMLCGLSTYIWNLKFCTQLRPLDTPLLWGCALMLAIFPTITSLETITFAIKLIGATRTAVLGALEPLTALFVGIVLFHEIITWRIACGVLLILSGIIFVVTARKN